MTEQQAIIKAGPGSAAMRLGNRWFGVYAGVHPFPAGATHMELAAHLIAHGQVERASDAVEAWLDAQAEIERAYLGRTRSCGTPRDRHPEIFPPEYAPVQGPVTPGMWWGPGGIAGCWSDP